MEDVITKKPADIANEPGEAYVDAIVNNVAMGGTDMGNSTMTKNKHQSCIDECNKCAQVCYECFKACLNEADVSARKNCISVLVECAQMAGM